MNSKNDITTMKENEMETTMKMNVGREGWQKENVKRFFKDMRRHTKRERERKKINKKTKQRRAQKYHQRYSRKTKWFLFSPLTEREKEKCEHTHRERERESRIERESETENTLRGNILH